MKEVNNHLLKNLHSLIRNSALTYMNEFIWQDVELTEEFKSAYTSYLKRNRYDVEFLGATAVITSPYAKYIYVPNQWFVIASYVVDVCEELQRYKEYFKRVSEKLNKRPDSYAKYLRDSATTTDKGVFINCARMIFLPLCRDDSITDEAASRLWRFASDYSWWSGQKTIDRGDFYVSVMLNTLNLVNVSQGYVADIVNAYVSDSRLRKLVTSIDKFTTNMTDADSTQDKSYIIPDEEIRNRDILQEKQGEYNAIPRPERVRIKISGTNTLKEIKYKG